jgi:hypothetical protein
VRTAERDESGAKAPENPHQKNPPIFPLNLGESPGRGGKIGSKTLGLHIILTPASDDGRRFGPVETPFQGGVSL